jgi:hypothetical protein
MTQSRAGTEAKTLGLDDELEDVELITAIEQSFGVKFGDETSNWTTVGDIYEALLARMPASSTVGLCATSMAFYRVRAALGRIIKVPARVTPTTKLAEFASIRPRRLCAKLARELGVAAPPWRQSWWGEVGGWLMFFGLVGFPLVMGAAWVAHWLGFSLQWPRPWHMLLLAPLGLAMLFSDMGAYGAMTVGDLARAVAWRNVAYFASMGADARPAALWSALCEICAAAAERGVHASNLTAETRLLA